MADNVTITSGANSTPPAGTIVATDDVGGVQYQRVKLDIGGDGVSVPVTSLDTSALALETTQGTGNTRLGDLTEGAPATDTASSGLNGRLQRIAQRLTSLIALLPASLGQKASTASLAVVIASDQSAVPVSGTVAVTQPVAVTDNAGTLTVDAPVGTPVFVRLSDGAAAITALPVSQSGSWTVTESSNATDGLSTEPSTDLISGWDGQNVRAAFVQAIDGRNTMFTHDPTSRRMLEDILVELRLQNAQMAKLLGAAGLTERDMPADARLIH